MDKFAVDLEKVLDDFEFNEGREEGVVPSVIKNSLQHICQKPLRPPAASYRRAAFEPISLADADFAAAPIPPSASIKYGVKQSSGKDGFVQRNDSIGDGQEVGSSPLKIVNDELNHLVVCEVKKEEFSSLTEEECQQDGPENYSTSSSEDTPDLLDSNSLKPSQNNVDGSEDRESTNQLPDITSSTRNTPIISSSLETSDEPVFDLIKPHLPTGQPAVLEEDLPLVVEVNSIIPETVPELCVIKPITFDPVCDVPDSELVEYLQSLEELEAISAAENTNYEEPLVFRNEDSLERPPGADSKEVGTLYGQSIVENSVSDFPVRVNGIQNHFSPTEGLLNNLGKVEVEEDTHVQKHIGTGCGNTDNDRITVAVPLVVSREEGEPVNVASFIPEPDGGTYRGLPIDAKTSQHIEIIGTENEEIENSQNEEKAVLHGEESGREMVDEYGDNLSKLYFNEEESSDGSALQCGDGPKPPRPNTLPIPSHIVTDSEESPTPTTARGNGIGNMMSPEERSLGKVPPFWVPDTEAENCMQCQSKFTVIKRRHHCRACGLVLCSKCCNLRAPLEYKDFQEVRVCQPCFTIIYRGDDLEGNYNMGRQPNPNNPMEYCSTIPPLQQAATALLQPPPSVLVPTGVLKREGRAKSDVPKQVMFSDGIRPGGDLTELDGAPESRLPPRRGVRRLATPPGGKGNQTLARRPLNPSTESFLSNDTNLPPAVTIHFGHLNFIDNIEEVTEEPVKFALNYNLFVNVKRVKLDCCVNRECWSMCSEGLACIGQDEIAVVLECLPDEKLPPQDIFHLVNLLHQDASKAGETVTEMSFTSSSNFKSSSFLGSKDHGGVLYIRPTLQCTSQLLLPPQPYLYAILVHRWETPWARLFPLRLVLRLGAEYRYYPTTLVSIRNRPPLYTDIGHTIMKTLVDFRKYSYSLPKVRGLLIHVEDRQTTVMFPRNRYDQVVKALNASNESLLAFGANLSLMADSHLVCIQGTQDENTYHTQAINIHNKPRKVTGASFVVFNGDLKTAGLSGKSSIMEDGLMVHLPSDSLAGLRSALREMKDYSISCGPNGEETVLLKWIEDDINFNIGVESCIDNRPLDGVPSIRVHNGTDYPNHSRIIRWTEVFIIQRDEGAKGSDPIDVRKVSESLARATCIALLPFLDGLAEASLTVIAVRATIHPDNVGYEAGSCGRRLPSQYMKRLDDELVPVVHQAAVTSHDAPAVLELLFRIMNHP